MQIDLSNSDEFERLLNRLATDVVDAAIFNRLSTDIDASTKEFWREFAQSPTFWALTRSAYVEVVLIRLIRVYDTDQRAVSLQSWLGTIRGNLHFFGAGSGACSPDVVLRGAEPPDADEFNRDIASVTPATDPLVKKLTILRGNIIAHTNAADVVDGCRLEDRFPLTFAEIDSLVSRAVAILNRYSILFKRAVWSTQIVGHDDFVNVLRAIRGDLKRLDAEVAGDIQRATSAASPDA